MSEARPEELLKALGNAIPALGAGVASFAVGVALLMDDAKDFGEIGGTEDHPDLFHHWMWGVLLIGGGAAGLGLGILSLLASDPRVTPEMRRKVEELKMARKILPPELIEELMVRAGAKSPR